MRRADGPGRPRAPGDRDGRRRRPRPALAPRPTGSPRSSGPTARSASRRTRPTPGWTTPLRHARSGRRSGVHADRAARARRVAARAEGPTLPRSDDPGPRRRARHDARRLALGRRHPLLARADRAGGPGPRPRRASASTPGSPRAPPDPRPRRSRPAAGTTATSPPSAAPPRPARPDGPRPAGPRAGRARGRRRSTRAIRYLHETLPGVRAVGLARLGPARPAGLGRAAGEAGELARRGVSTPSAAAPTPRRSSPACSWPSARDALGLFGTSTHGTVTRRGSGRMGRTNGPRPA